MAVSGCGAATANDRWNYVYCAVATKAPQPASTRHPGLLPNTTLHNRGLCIMAALRHWRSAEIDPEEICTISESTQYFSYARSIGNNCGFQTTSHRWLSGS